MTGRFEYTRDGYLLARQFLKDIGYWEKAHMGDNGHTEQQAVDIANVWVEIGIKWHKEAFEKYIEAKQQPSKMNWQKLTKENKPPYGKKVLVDYGQDNYYVIHLIYDEELRADLWVEFEGYSSFISVKHFCYIDKP